ncbi:MAG: hypothetical protein GC172_03220 [Phycisphaera sp.]|nr:hypothetical protein [Phycisphaera sp.]
MTDFELSHKVDGPSDLAVRFACDVHERMRIGAMCEKGGTVGLASGIGFGAGAALGGHWAIALAGIAIGALAKAAASNHRQSQFDQMQAKWQGILRGLSDSQLRQFVLEIGTCYPQLTGALSSYALGTPHAQRLLQSL